MSAYKSKTAGFLVEVSRGFGESFEKKFKKYADARKYAKRAIREERGYSVRLFALSVVTEIRYTEYSL